MQSNVAIIKAYRELVEANAGKLIGSKVFMRETGVSKYAWNGGYWRNWAAFQEELGYVPNAPTQRIEDQVVLQRFAELASSLDRVPTEPDIDLKRKSDSSFPSKAVFRRWGNKEAMLAQVAEYCKGKPEFEVVSRLLEEGNSAALDQRIKSLHIEGFVYLLRSGKHYKIGRTNASGRRLRELAIQLPRKPDTVHVIETDDPEGIEQYWHRRFDKKREGGEWFSLSAEDVKAFKKRRFQ